MNRRNLAGLLAIAIVIGAAPLAGQKQVAVGDYPPLRATTLPQLCGEAQLVIKATVSRSAIRKRVDTNLRREDFRTVFSARVLEVYKVDAERGTPPGTDVGIGLPIGEASVGGKTRELRGGPKPLLPQHTYVLFLKWSPTFESYYTIYGPAGIYEVIQGALRSDSAEALPIATSGKSSTEVESELRGSCQSGGAAAVIR